MRVKTLLLISVLLSVVVYKLLLQLRNYCDRFSITLSKLEDRGGVVSGTGATGWKHGEVRNFLHTDRVQVTLQ